MMPPPVKPPRIPPTRPTLQRSAENYRAVSEKEDQHDKKLLCHALSFSVGLQERLARLVPCRHFPLAGEWQGRPESYTADAILWKLAGLVKYDLETRFTDPDDFRLLINEIAERIGIDDDDAWGLFARSYAKVRQGTGSSNQVLQSARLDAENDILHGFDADYVGNRRVYRDQRRRLLVGIFFYVLNSGQKGERFVSTRNAGALIGVDASTAAAWIRGMVADKYLKKIADGTEFKSPRYQWIDARSLHTWEPGELTGKNVG